MRKKLIWLGVAATAAWVAITATIRGRTGAGSRTPTRKPSPSPQDTPRGEVQDS
jgi:hypothetical protein